MSGDNTYSGATTIDAGATLQAGSTTALASTSAFTVDGTLDLNGFDNTIGSLAGTSTGTVEDGSATAATLTVGDSSSTTFAGDIKDGSGSLSLTETGSGTLTLSGDNTYSGATTIGANSTLELSGSGSIADTSGVTLDNGATLDLSSSSSTGLSATKPIIFTAGNSAAETVDIADTASTYTLTVKGSSWTDDTQILDFTGITYSSASLGGGGDTYTLTGTTSSSALVTVTIDVTGGLPDYDSLYLADAGGGTEVLIATEDEWIKPNSGNGNGQWTLAAGWSEGVPTSSENAVIDLPGAYTVTLSGGTETANSLIITDSDATVSGSGTLEITTIVNDGIIEAGFFQTLVLEPGAGPGFSPSITNSGSLEANGLGAVLLIENTTIDNTGTIEATGSLFGFFAAQVELDNVTITGGTLETDSYATIETVTSGSASTFSGVTIEGNVQVNAGTTLTFDDGTTMTSGTLTVESGGTLMLEGASLGGGTITDNGTLTGYGTVASDIAAGSGTITASGGTLDLSGTVASGDAFTIATTTASVLEFTNTATAAAAIAISSANQTLEIGAGGNLTIDAAESITQGTIELAGGTLTDSDGVTIGSGASLTGYGTVAAHLTGSGSGEIEASGGVLDVTGTLTGGSALDFVSGGTLEVAGSGTNAANAFTLSAGELEITSNLTISGAQSVTGGTIELVGGTLTDSAGITVSSGELTGDGTVAANLTGSGTGGIEASGGVLDVTGTLTGGSALDFVSGGTLEVSGSGTNTATAFDLVSGATLEVASNLTVSGGVSGTGSFTIENNAVLVFDSSDTANVAFATGRGTIEIDQTITGSTLTFGGLISGITSNSVFDLADLTYTSGHMSYEATFSGGDTTVTVTNSHTDQSVVFTVAGDHTNWTLSDSGGHTNLVDPPATALTIAAGATSTIDTPSSGAVTFAGGTGELVLEQPGSFDRQILGFTGTAPDAAHSDVIDLAGLNYNSSHFSESYNSATDVLTVTDGTNTASLTFVDFTGTFKFASDGTGGTDIFDPPATNSSGPPVSIGGPGNDNFVFHPGLGADADISNSPDHTTELERLTSAQAQHWSPVIGNDAHDAAIDFVHHGDGVASTDGNAVHWHLALHNTVHLY